MNEEPSKLTTNKKPPLVLLTSLPEYSNEIFGLTSYGKKKTEYNGNI